MQIGVTYLNLGHFMTDPRIWPHPLMNRSPRGRTDTSQRLARQISVEFGPGIGRPVGIIGRKHLSRLSSKIGCQPDGRPYTLVPIRPESTRCWSTLSHPLRSAHPFLNDSMSHGYGGFMVSGRSSDGTCVFVGSFSVPRSGHR